MKKIFLFLLIILSINAYSQTSVRMGKGNLYYNNDSSLFRFSNLVSFPFGLKTNNSVYINGGGLFIPNADNITLTGGSIFLNGGALNVNSGNYFWDGTSLKLLFGETNDTNKWLKINTFDLLRGTRPIFTGMITGDSLSASALKMPNFFSMFKDGDNAFDFNDDHWQMSAKNYIAFRTDGVTRAFIDANGLGADSVHGLAKSLKVKAGRITTDTMIATKYYSGVTSGNYALNVADDTLFNFRSSLFQDSSYMRLSFNAWTGSNTFELFGKSGNNMLTADSAGLSTSLPFTNTSSSTSSFTGGLKGLWFEGASGQYIGLTSKFIMTSSADGKIKLLNYAGNGFTSLAFGLETSAFPMLKRNGKNLELKTGDDAGFTGLKVDTLNANVVRQNDSLVATQNWARNNARPYKVYTVLLSQTGTSAPTATVLENSLGGTVVWSYTGAGTYTATLVNGFGANANKMWSIPTTVANNNTLNWNSSDDVILTISDGDNILDKFAIEIRIYN